MEEPGRRHLDGGTQTEAPAAAFATAFAAATYGGNPFLCRALPVWGRPCPIFSPRSPFEAPPIRFHHPMCVVGNMRVAIRRLPSKQRSSVRRPAHFRLSPTQFYACPQWPHTSPQTCTRLPAHGLLPHAPEGRESQPYSSVSLVLRPLHPLTPHSRSSAISSVLFRLSSFSSPFFSSSPVVVAARRGLPRQVHKVRNTRPPLRLLLPAAAPLRKLLRARQQCPILIRVPHPITAIASAKSVTTCINACSGLCTG